MSSRHQTPVPIRNKEVIDLTNSPERTNESVSRSTLMCDDSDEDLIQVEKELLELYTVKIKHSSNYV